MSERRRLEGHLRDGPYAGDRALLTCAPEHVRVWYCRGCIDTHWADEADPWPRGAARYALVDSSSAPVIYVYDGIGDGVPEVSEREEELAHA